VCHPGGKCHFAAGKKPPALEPISHSAQNLLPIFGPGKAGKSSLGLVIAFVKKDVGRDPFPFEGKDKPGTEAWSLYEAWDGPEP
jgi:hypothetical protein